jgi:hypothetical protein
MVQMHDNMSNMHNMAMDKINGVMTVIAAPKKIIRGPDGRASGVEVIQ